MTGTFHRNRIAEISFSILMFSTMFKTYFADGFIILMIFLKTLQKFTSDFSAVNDAYTL